MLPVITPSGPSGPIRVDSTPGDRRTRPLSEVRLQSPRVSAPFPLLCWSLFVERAGRRRRIGGGAGRTPRTAVAHSTTDRDADSCSGAAKIQIAMALKCAAAGSVTAAPLQY